MTVREEVLRLLSGSPELYAYLLTVRKNYGLPTMPHHRRCARLAHGKGAALRTLGGA